MGFRDWLPGSSETPQEAAARLRGEALSDPDAVDAAQLVELFREAETDSVARTAAKGVEAVARERPDRLAEHVPALLAGAATIDGVGADHRGELAVAVERVAEVDPEAVAAQADALLESLERELRADEQPGHEVRLDERKAAALCRAVGTAGVSEARPLLLKLRQHHGPEVGDAARDAIKKLSS
jgi:hypothetical protein